MQKKSITRIEEFETAHLLPNHSGFCKNLHGHSYKIAVTIEGPYSEEFGMIMDFKELKEVIKACVPDHKFICGENSEIEKDIVEVLKKHKIDYETYPFKTSVENLISFLALRIQSYISHTLKYSDIDVINVKLWETSNSYAEWSKS